MSRKIQLKWKEKIYEDFIVHTTSPVGNLKNDIKELTNVPVNRQKIIFKGLIKDTTDLSLMNIKDGDRFTLIGNESAVIEDNIPSNNEKSNEGVTAEAPAEEDSVVHPDELPVMGITNLGNTCYFNSVIQFLRPVKEFIGLVKNYKSREDVNLRNIDIKSFKGTLAAFFSAWKACDSPLNPIIVVTALRLAFPQFSRLDPNEMTYMQQDAEECLCAILDSFYSDQSSHMGEVHVDDIFCFKILNKMKVGENGDLKIKEIIEKHRKLNCYMGSQIHRINNIEEGIRLSFVQDYDKESTNGVKNEHENEGTVSTVENPHMITVPKYLIVHFVRFEMKKASQTSRTEAARAKVCRKISFYPKLDLYPFSSKKLQKEFSVARMILSSRYKMNPELREFEFCEEINQDSATKTVEFMEFFNSEKFGEYKGNSEVALGMSEIEKVIANATVNLSNDVKVLIRIRTGFYQILSILTHKGRDIDVGHYICWTKEEKTKIRNEGESPEQRSIYSNRVRTKGSSSNDYDIWYKIDDDIVTTNYWKDIDLCGGRSDYHIAFLNLYKGEYIYATIEELKEHL